MDSKGVIVWPTAVNLLRRLCPGFLQRQPADRVPGPSHGGSTIFLPHALSPGFSLLVVSSPYRTAVALRRLPQHMAANLRLRTLTLQPSSQCSPHDPLQFPHHKCQSRNVPLVLAPPPPSAPLRETGQHSAQNCGDRAFLPLNLPPPLAARRPCLKTNTRLHE